MVPNPKNIHKYFGENDLAYSFSITLKNFKDCSLPRRWIISKTNQPF